MLALAWPLVVANLAQTALTTSDVVMMGALGPDTLAAGALATSLFMVSLIFGIGLVTATAPLMAQERGRRRHSVRDVRRTVRQGWWVAATYAAPVWLVLWQAEAILRHFGQDPALARASGRYMHALQWTLLPFLLSVVLRSFLSALERPGWTLVAGLAAVPVNVGLAYWLMFGAFGLPGFGLIGAGLATTATSVALCASLALVIARDRRLKRYALFGRWWRTDWQRYAAIWRIGAPIGATLLFEVGLFSAAALVMGHFGAAVLAAHQIALQIASLCFMVPLGVSQAATVRVGLAAGAGDRAGVRRAGWVAYGLGVGSMALTALTLVAIPRTLAGAFLARGDPASAGVVDVAVSFLAFVALFQIVDGAQVVGAGVLRGLSDTRVPMLTAAFGYWGVGAILGVALAFGTPLGPIGIWIGLSTGLAVVAAMLLARWIRMSATSTSAQAAMPRGRAA